MYKLILVKHSKPRINPDIPAKEWVLSDKGSEYSRILAEELQKFDADIIVTSMEPKAQKTGEIVGEYLRLPVIAALGLHEHDRENAGFLSEEDFKNSVIKFFTFPGELVFGNETAKDAKERFINSVKRIVSERQGKNIIIVAHGTVITLFAKEFNEIDAYEFWKKLNTPSYVVFSLPEFKIESVTAEIR